MIQASIARFCYIAPYMEVMGVTSFLSVDRAKMPSGNKNYPLAAVGTPRKIQGMQSPEGYCWWWLDILLEQHALHRCWLFFGSTRVCCLGYLVDSCQWNHESHYSDHLHQSTSSQPSFNVFMLLQHDAKTELQLKVLIVNIYQEKWSAGTVPEHLMSGGG